MAKLDLSLIASGSTADSVVSPREVFSVLPNKDPKYTYLRDVQSEALDQWYAKRLSRDLRLKMNTGGGKTLVGLLILKSCLNESYGPAAFISPTPYLASQVMQEAKAVGIAVDDDPRATAVARGKSILVTTIKKLLNGKSQFGVGEILVDIGSFVLDDAHACLAGAEEQFTLQLPFKHPCSKKLISLFKSDLEEQSSSILLDIKHGEPHKLMLVPFWAWQAKIKDVEQILHAEKDDESLQWAWPLLSAHLRSCRCVFGNQQIEISPRCLPVSVVPSFSNARRRVFMSATFADDSVLVTDFDVNPTEISEAIAPSIASDIGDRMILVPQELNPEISDDEIKKLVKQKSKKHNVVVIVPSGFRATFWADVASLTMTADTLESGVKKLQEGHVGVAVIVNKYDGIDLPNNACRLLVIDGLPDVRRGIDRIEQSSLHSCNLFIGKSIQQIEQGMGRGVRAADDYCAVILMGKSLVGQLFSKGGIDRFSPATCAQFELSEKIGEQIRGKGIADVSGALEYCLGRDPEWVKLAKAALVHVKYSKTSSDLNVAIARRSAFNSLAIGDNSGAVRALQGAVNECSEAKYKGWLMSELAEYTNFVNLVESQQILRSALQLNPHLPVRTQAGIDYVRLNPIAGNQATACLAFLRENFSDNPSNLLVAVNAVMDDLEFREDSSKRFERALGDIASFIGFEGQLPETQYGKGPDCLWAVGGLKYFVIEAKNEAVADEITKDYCNQLGGSVNWFGDKYDSACSCVPILIHPSAKFQFAATPHADTRIMNAEKLPKFCEAVLGFCRAASKLPMFGQPREIVELFSQYKLLPTLIQSEFTVPPVTR